MQNCLNVVVVAGDVDSGKSTLIGRILYELETFSGEVIQDIANTCKESGRDFEFAYLLDSFEEERKHRLTIDTTQAYCRVKRGKEFVFIDVPGHQELLKNMLCGSSYADIAILLVDVQKSIEEQTKRHAFILELLGIEQIILVLNKMDSVYFNKIVFRKVSEEIAKFFQNIQFHPKYFIPISAEQGENLIQRSARMPWYKGLTLIEALSACAIKKSEKNNFRFPIQDIYSQNREKIAVGRIISGQIKVGEIVCILPLNKKSEVKAIKTFNGTKFMAKTFESAGLVLNEMDDLRRGQVICKNKLPKITTEFLAKIFCIQSLNLKQYVRFKCATQDTAAKIKQINRIWNISDLKPKCKKIILEKANFAETVIVTRNPVVVERFDGANSIGRFVLQNNGKICAIGVIL